MDCLVGSSTGILKTVNMKDNTFRNVNDIRSAEPKSDEIRTICWSNEHQSELLCAQMNRQLKLFDTGSGLYTEYMTVEGGQGPIRGLGRLNDLTMASAVESGLVQVWNSGSKQITNQWQVGANLLTMRTSPMKSNILATGGRENPLKLWDVDRPSEPMFIAKNVRPNWLELRVPIWVNDVQFLHDSDNVVTCTGKYQIQVYDPKTAQRRPVKEFEWLSEPLTCMSICVNPKQVVVGNTKGEMGLFDLRNKAHLVHKFKGFSGSIRSIDAHKMASFVASCGIDRFVRVHDLNTRKLVKKIYCKARLNCLLLKNDCSLTRSETNIIKNEVKTEPLSDSQQSDSEDDTIWNEMDLVSDRTSEGKRKHKENGKNDGVKMAKLKEKRTRKVQNSGTIVETKRRRMKKIKRSFTVLDDNPDVDMKRFKDEVTQ